MGTVVIIGMITPGKGVAECGSQTKGRREGGPAKGQKKSDPPILMVRLTASLAEVVSDATLDGSDNNDKDPVETLRIRTKIWWE